MAVNVYASATSNGESVQLTGGGSVTIDCPDVGNSLTSVPEQASPEVARELALLDEQIAAAYRQLQDQAQAVRQDPGFADNAVMNPLKEKRGATIGRIVEAIDRSGDRPEGLDSLAACTLRITEDQEQGQGQGQEEGQDQGQDQKQNDGQGQGPAQGSGQNDQQGNGGQAGNGPVAGDYADITSVQPAQQTPDPSSGPSRGTFVTSCGVNENGLFNSDNVIVAPGVSNGAHHFHDYVGNQSNTAFASDEDLANADTSCVDQGDKSTYYWPVLRLQNGAQEKDAGSPGGGIEGNAGEIVTPKAVTLTFVGNPRSQVTAMPRLLRIITGDAKAFVNGPANANASWSCTGFEDRQLKDKYPLCPAGSDVVRTFHFQSCWDGSNIDSANHRTHVAFAAADGACPTGFEAVPQLVQRIVYDVDAPSLADGGKTTPLFAVDSFPEQLHKPVTDHGDFINVFDDDLMTEMVDCINAGRTCGAGTAPGNDDGGNGGDNGSGNGGADNGGGNGSNGGADNGGGNGSNGGADNGGDNGSNGGSDDATQQPPAQSPQAPAPGKDPAAGDAGSGTVTHSAEPRADTKPSADSGGEIGDAATAPADQTPTPADTTPADTGTGTGGYDQTEPQAVQGGLAETGADLWPAAVGGLLVIAGFVLLRRTAFRHR
ncbi:DUF1996 domain-containing protein [Streptomyces sp. NBC_01275]|uniref:DUF1996 domain-containing protein n=1 Tax=Streptomyces sp. NBC_01275 TaxID=2903807 RepID=UPI00225C1FB6|nr:DUF1996 domain-containing protein [Streptomyces sp. NBC_01275]MCX4767165.1 DUF1996 domain-containing protein [Streptomyces sp. NBC_01275]